LDFGGEALFQASSTKKSHGTPQESLLILLDFLVRIEPFQGLARTPGNRGKFPGELIAVYSSDLTALLGGQVSVR